MLFVLIFLKEGLAEVGDKLGALHEDDSYPSLRCISFNGEWAGKVG